MNDKFNDFIVVTKFLNLKGITPILYGSLSLYRIIDPPGPVDDIDFLVPEVWLKDRWPEFKLYLESGRFQMDDEHEHEFSHPEIKGWVAFGSIEEANNHSGLDVKSCRLAHNLGAQYYVLSAQQYLSVYESSLKDSYRQTKKGDADILKIKAITEFIKQNKPR